MYHPYIQFRTRALRQVAEELSRETRAFYEGGILTNPAEGWENIFYHCLTEAAVVKHLCAALNHSNAENMVLAAFVHDAYKRCEVETMNQITHGRAEAFLETEEAGSSWLGKLGYSPEVVHLQTAYGDCGARDIFLGRITDFDRRLLHYVDDICYGDQIVTVEERMQRLEATPRYEAQNQWYRQYFGGFTLYQAKRFFNEQTEREIAAIVKISSFQLIPWIKQRIEN